MRKTAVFAAALIVVLACGERTETPEDGARTTTAATATTVPQLVVVGQPMPAYSAKLLDGSEFNLANEKGNVVFLNLWATWCGPCRYEIPELEKLHKDLAAKSFKVVGVSVDEGGDQIVREFVDEQNMTYPVALDPEGQLATLMDTTILPTSIIVDRQGNVVWKKLGVVTTTDTEMIRVLEQALAG